MKTRSFWIPATIIIAALLVGLAAIGQTTAVKPVIVRDIDNGDRMEQVYSLVGGPISAGEDVIRLCSTTVPAGKRLVLEHLSIRAEVPTGQHPTAQFYAQGSPAQIVHNITLAPEGPGSAIRDLFSASTPITVRLPASASPCLVVSRYPAASNGIVSFTYSGYLVDIP